MRTLDLAHRNFASLLAITALIFLFLVVLGLGRPAFATAYMADDRYEASGSSRAAGVMQQHLNPVQS